MQEAKTKSKYWRKNQVPQLFSVRFSRWFISGWGQAVLTPKSVKQEDARQSFLESRAKYFKHFSMASEQARLQPERFVCTKSGLLLVTSGWIARESACWRFYFLDLWINGGSICSQLNKEVLRNIKEVFTDLQTQVKLKLLLSFFHIPRRLIDEVSKFRGLLAFKIHQHKQAKASVYVFQHQRLPHRFCRESYWTICVILFSGRPSWMRFWRWPPRIPSFGSRCSPNPWKLCRLRALWTQKSATMTITIRDRYSTKWLSWVFFTKTLFKRFWN